MLAITRKEREWLCLGEILISDIGGWGTDMYTSLEGEKMQKTHFMTKSDEELEVIELHQYYLIWKYPLSILLTIILLPCAGKIFL